VLTFQKFCGIIAVLKQESEKMPKRNEKLKSRQAFWVKMPNGKGYTVYSEKTLQKMLENGEIGENDLVQLRVIS